MGSGRQRAALIAAGAAVLLLAGVVARRAWDDKASEPRSTPARSDEELPAPVDPSDPLALLVQCEPSADGRWLVFGLDFERVAGAQSLYLVSLESGERSWIAEGALAPQPWDADGRLVFIDRSPNAPRVRWLEVESGKVAREGSLADLPRTAFATDAPSWALRTQTRRAQGGYVERIERRGTGAVLQLVTHSLFDVEISPRPGIAFELRRRGEQRWLLRHELFDAVREQVLLESQALALFRLSPDGQKLLTSERADGRISYSARSSDSGELLVPSWEGERVSATWLEGQGSRYVLVGIGSQASLIDLDTRSSTALGAHEVSDLDVRVLPTSRILRRTERCIDVLDGAGAVVLQVFPPR